MNGSRRSSVVASMASRMNKSSAKSEEKDKKRMNEEEFAFWVRRKDNLVRGLELFRRLEDSRAEDFENWKEIAEALAAIEQAMNLGNADLIEQKRKKEKALKEQGQAPGKKESLYDSWRKWTMDNTNIIDIKLTQDEVNNLTKGTLSLCEHDEETGTYTLPSLKYTAPKSTSAATTRKLTKDQRVQNAIFLKRCRMHWREAHQQVREKLAKYVVDAEQRIREKHQRDLEKKGVSEEEDLYDAGPKIDRLVLEDKGLLALGIQRLHGWLEEDEDKAKAKKDSREQDREDEAKMAHAGFLRKKNATRVRLPPSKGDKFMYNQAKRVGGTFKPPRMDFSQGKKRAVRPKPETVPHNTVQIMMESNLKYIHALNLGQQGRAGDLEFCREELEKLGHVYKENFEESSDFRRELYQNPKKIETKRILEQRAKSAENAYQEWLQKKNMYNEAVKAIENIDKPIKDASLVDVEEEQKRWLLVGRSLKAVDRKLRQHFIKWSEGFCSAAVCKAAWDGFPPKACDVHTDAYSALRDTFLKLLKPGVNYVEAFQRTLDRKIKRMEAEDEDWTDEKGAELSQNMALNRKEMARFLMDLGIAVKKEELRRLVDAFDLNRDGKIAMKEFLQFTGDWRLDMAGDRFQRLNQRCIWETTCQVTGMPNAYTVSEFNKKQPRSIPQDCVLELPSGEKRLRLEVPERKRRVEILKQLGVLGAKEKKKPKKEEEEEEYGDDFDDDDDDDDYSADEDQEELLNDANPFQGEKMTLFRKPCEASQWKLEDAKKSLGVLQDRSKENREAAELKEMLKNGKPPPAPKLSAAPLGHEDVGWDDVILTTELLLVWSPIPDSLVAFFSLEMASGETIRSSGVGKDTRWIEICRDPPDAESEAEYQHWVMNLDPNRPYHFRLRAFNGFGPGPYTHAQFTTRPAKPQTPVAIRIAPTMITVQWEFSAQYQARMQDLKELFDDIDRDHNGFVARSQLLAHLQNPGRSQLLDFMMNSTVGVDTSHVRDSEGGSALTVLEFLEAQDGDITWQELLHYFQAHGAVNMSVRRSGTLGRSVSVSGDSLRGSRSRQSSKNPKTKFVLEQCTSQRERQYKKVWEGSDTRTTLKGLVPGTSHRLRVYAINQQGTEGAPSDSIVVNTLLETPGAPVLAGRLHQSPLITANGSTSNSSLLSRSSTSVSSKSVRLKWDPLEENFGGRLPAQKGMKSGREQQAAEKIMQQWARAGAEDTGLNLELVFRKYDRDLLGYIESSDLRNLLEDLGVEPSLERLRDAISILDEDGQDIIPYPEFEYWWEHSGINYIIKRTEGISWKAYKEDQEERRKFSVLCFRGPGTQTEVTGLTPNTYYEFRLKAQNARAQSSHSQPIAVMTAPSQPKAPVVILTENKAAWLKWYPGEGGACKYCLQSRLVEVLDADHRVNINARISTSRRNKTDGPAPYLRHKTETAWNEDERDLPQYNVNATEQHGEHPEKKTWRTVYEGPDIAVKVTGLIHNSVYRFRLFAVNQMGIFSEASELTQVSTCHTNRPSLKPGNAAETFTIECTEDVVVGDTILFTERLFIDEQGRLLNNSGKESGRSRRSSSRINVGDSHFSISSRASGMPDGEFVGERTVAARILKDSELSAKTTINKKQAIRTTYVQTKKPSSRRRILRMEVIWSTVSRRETEQFTLERGIIIERTEHSIFQYESFRVPWEQERKRKSAREEIKIICS